MTHRTVLAVTAAACALVTLAACGDKAKPGGDAVAITATDSGCQVGRTTFEPGPVRFSVTNKGTRTTEVYVYGEKDGRFTRVISEVENIGPGLTRELKATLGTGRYEIACKPGQKGDGIRTPITVSGGGAGATATTGAAYDREIEVEVTATGVDGADGLSARAGEKIEFKLENTAAATRALEVIDPSGKVVAEVEAPAGGTGETIVTLGTAGAWTLKIEGDGAVEVEKKFPVG